MEKIEKLEEFNWVSGRDAITIALCNTIIRKQNEIIDHLNSQDQEEEKIVRSKEDIERTDYTGYPYSKEFQSTTGDTLEEINPYEKITKEYVGAFAKDEEKGDIKRLREEVKDTPEEWDRLRRDGALAFYIELEDWLYEKGYAKGGEIKVPTEVFMQFVSKELKLNNKKK